MVADKAAPILHTERLRLEIPGPERAGAMAAYLLANEAWFRPSRGDLPRQIFTADYWEVRLAKDLERFHADQAVRFALFEPGGDAIIGTCAINNIVRGALQAGTLGYALAEDVAGRGLCTEAARRVVQYAFEDLGLHRVEAGYMPTNTKSGAVLRRLGFQPYGYARDYLKVGETWQDHVLVYLHAPG